MPNERAAPDIDPCDAMASSNAILAGPNLRSFGKTMRMERRGLAIALPMCDILEFYSIPDFRTVK
jgi:hypothetical protein